MRAARQRGAGRWLLQPQLERLAGNGAATAASGDYVVDCVRAGNVALAERVVRALAFHKQSANASEVGASLAHAIGSGDRARIWRATAPYIEADDAKTAELLRASQQYAAVCGQTTQLQRSPEAAAHLDALALNGGLKKKMPTAWRQQFMAQFNLSNSLCNELMAAARRKHLRP